MYDNEINLLLGTGEWLSSTAFAEMTGRKQGGNLERLAQQHKVRTLRFPAQNGSRSVRTLFHRADVHLLPPLVKAITVPEPVLEDSSMSDVVGGESNGGKLAHRIKALEQRMSALEQFRADLEG